MARADARGAQIERAVIDLAEAVMLQGREGEAFEAVVTDEDERGVRIQLCELPIVARVVAHRVEPGDTLRVTLVAADPGQAHAVFPARCLTATRRSQVFADHARLGARASATLLRRIVTNLIPKFP